MTTSQTDNGALAPMSRRGLLRGAAMGGASLAASTLPVSPAGARAPAPPAAGERVRTVPVSFTSAEVTLRGELFLPADAAGPVAGIVCAGTWTSVRQQMTDHYAQGLAAEGLAALSFDFASYGESDGNPRQIESPRAKILDLVNAARFLADRPEVDGARLGGLGICASAGYMAHAIQRGAPLRAFATSAAWMHDPRTVGLMYGGAAGVGRRIRLARAARRHFRRTGEVRYVPAHSRTDRSAAMTGIDFYARASRGRIPQWRNRFAVMQWEEWLRFDALSPAQSIEVPSLFIHSDRSALPDNVRRFHANVRGPKTLVWAQGEHTQFYDNPRHVGFAVGTAAAHFRTVLDG